MQGILTGMVTERAKAEASARARWQRRVDAVKARRKELGDMTQIEGVARSGGLVSAAVWNRFENLRGSGDFDVSTLKGICVALGWRDDAFTRIDQGLAPLVDVRADMADGDPLTVAQHEADRALGPGRRAVLKQVYADLAANEWRERNDRGGSGSDG